MFTSGQLVGLYVFTLFILYCILSKIMDLIRFNRYAKMWMKYYETIKYSGITIPKPMKEIDKKEEKEDEYNDSGRSERNSEA